MVLGAPRDSRIRVSRDDDIRVGDGDGDGALLLDVDPPVDHADDTSAPPPATLTALETPHVDFGSSNTAAAS